MLFDFPKRTFPRLIDSSIGIFFVSCMLGSATGFRNIALAGLVLLSLATKSWLVLCDKRLKYFILIGFGFLLANIPGAYTAENFSSVLNLSKEYLIAILLMALGVATGRDGIRWRNVVRWQIAAVALLAIMSLGIAWIQAEPGRDIYVFSHWYPWYGIATTIAVMLIPLCFLYFDKDIWPTGKSELIFLGFCLFVVLACALNRASFIVILFLVLYFCARYFDSYRTKVSLFSFAVIVSVAGFIYQANQRLQSDGSEKYTMAHSIDVMKKTIVHDSRIAGWDFWIDKAVAQMPWYGFGIEKRSMVRLLSESEKKDPRVAATGLVSHAHNLLLNTWLRSGYPGVLMFLLMWGYLYKQLGVANQKSIPNPSEKLSSLVGRAVLLSLLLKNMSDDFFEPPIIYLAIIWLGLLWGRVHRDSVFLAEGMSALEMSRENAGPYRREDNDSRAMPS